MKWLHATTYKIAVGLVLLHFCACREVVVYHDNVKPAARAVEIFYYHPTAIRGDTLVWYSPTAHVYENNTEIVKIANGTGWRSTFVSGSSLVAIYWRVEYIGGVQTAMEIRRFLQVLQDTTWNI